MTDFKVGDIVVYKDVKSLRIILQRYYSSSGIEHHMATRFIPHRMGKAWRVIGIPSPAGVRIIHRSEVIIADRDFVRKIL